MMVRQRSDLLRNSFSGYRLDEVEDCLGVLEPEPFVPSTSRNIRNIQLPNRIPIPLLGLGTTHSGGYNHDAVVYALKDAGYKMIDTAKRYGVEQDIGLAIKESGIHRSDLFLISKLWPVDSGQTNATAAFNESCRRLGVDYLDAYLIHFPQLPDWISNQKQVRRETWRALELLYDAGKCRSIGVSNYCESDLDDVLDECSVAPHVNQYECHPLYNPKRLRTYCYNKNILFMGYCPLGKGKILTDERLVGIAAKYNRTVSQVCLRWSVQQGVPAIPKSTKHERLLQNSKIFDFELSPEDMQSMSHGLHRDDAKCVMLDNVQAKFQLPDGYKLAAANN